jgi:hypothetical protein
VDERLERVEWLRAASDRVGALGALWDLRDLAYDRPALWGRFTAETLFQSIAEEVDRASDDAVDWGAFSSLLVAALNSAVEWSDRGTGDG